MNGLQGLNKARHKRLEAGAEEERGKWLAAIDEAIKIAQNDRIGMGGYTTDYVDGKLYALVELLDTMTNDNDS